MSSKEILETEAFLKESVDEINKKIDETEAHVVVLNGGRGCGKTSVLLSRERDSVDSNNLSVYQIFESYGKNFNYDKLDRQLVECYHELLFSQHLLGYIRDNKSDLFHRYEELYREIDDRRIAVLKFIMSHGYYSRIKFNEFDVKKGDYTLRTIDYLKKTFDKDKITLMIDRFDWMDNRSKSSQEYISKYFDMFDKVVLTTDDENYASNYPTITVDYGQDIDVTVEILKRYVVLSNSTKEFQSEMFDPVDVNAKTIEYLFNRAKGNLTVMKQVISELSYYSYDKAIVTEEDLLEQYKSLTDRKIKVLEKTNSFSDRVKPRFHI